MAKKITIDFVPNNETVNVAVDSALLTQLMVTITQIGIRIDNHKSNNDIIVKEKENDEKSQQQR